MNRVFVCDKQDLEDFGKRVQHFRTINWIDVVDFYVNRAIGFGVCYKNDLDKHTKDAITKYQFSKSTDNAHSAIHHILYQIVNLHDKGRITVPEDVVLRYRTHTAGCLWKK